MTTQTARHKKEVILSLQYCSLKSERHTGKLHLTINYEGTPIRRIFKPCQRSQAIEICTRQDDALIKGEGLIQAISKEKVHKTMDLVQAFTAWIESLQTSGRSQRHIANSVQSANIFLEWLTTAYPKVKEWEQLTKKHVAS